MSISSKISSVKATQAGLEVVFPGAKTPEIYSWFWLYDHSQDASRYNTDTKQRKVDTFLIDPTISGASAELKSENHVVVNWSDASAPGEYSAELLASALVYDTHAQHAIVSKQLWLAGSMPDPIPCSEFEAVVSTDKGARELLDAFAKFGFATVRNMPANEQAAEQLARRVAYPRQTIFGGIWKLHSELKDHNDTAYTQTFLEPHTDSTYSHDAPGSQMFCCIERTGTGGESILVDGLAVANQIREQDPKAFTTLTTTVVPGLYIEPGVYLRAERPAIRLDPYGNIVQISFNNYDRAPLKLPNEQMAEFYRSYGLLHKLVNDRDNWLKIRLNSGDALIFDNWRTLHGRMEYTGKRLFIGCYHNREDIESRRRVLQHSA